MWSNSACDSFIAGLAETRTNRQNYLRAVARCSHSWGDLQASFSVHASQWWSLCSGASSAHAEVLGSRGKPSWMVTAMESMHEIVLLKLKPSIIQIWSPESSQSAGGNYEREWLRDFCVSAQKSEYSLGIFFFQDLHERVVARGRASSRVSLSTIMGGLMKEMLPGGVKGGGSKCPQIAQTVHLGLLTSPGIFGI